MSRKDSGWSFGNRPKPKRPGIIHLLACLAFAALLVGTAML